MAFDEPSAQLLLDFGRLREREEAPSRRRTRRLVPRDQETVSHLLEHYSPLYDVKIVTYVGTSLRPHTYQRPRSRRKSETRTRQNILICKPLVIRDVRCHVRLK